MCFMKIPIRSKKSIGVQIGDDLADSASFGRCDKQEGHLEKEGRVCVMK